jgi:hypothetical protein
LHPLGWRDACQVRHAEARTLLSRTVPGPLGVMSGRAGAVHVASGGLRGGQVLVDLLEFAVNGSLALQVLTVQAADELMSWLLP